MVLSALFAQIPLQRTYSGRALVVTNISQKYECVYAAYVSAHGSLIFRSLRLHKKGMDGKVISSGASLACLLIHV